MESKQWCVIACEEAMHSIIEAEKLVQQGHNDAFDKLKTSMIDIFRGLTVKISEIEEDRRQKLQNISQALANENSNENGGPGAALLKENMKQLQKDKSFLEDRLKGFTKDIHQFKNEIDDSRAAAKAAICDQCGTKPKDALFLPCNHFIYCETCSDDMKDCTYCGGKIADRIIVEF